MAHRFAAMLTCIDGRVQRPLADWARERLAVDYVDTITEPGIDSQLVAMDDAALTRLMAKVRISQQAHGSDVLVIAGHSDCAGNPVPDHSHRDQLRLAAARLAARLPRTRIVAVHAGRCGPDCWRPQLVAEVTPVPPPGGSRKDEPAHMNEVDLTTFAAANADGGLVLDVREPFEYVTGHIPGARMLPMGQLPLHADELPRTEPVYVVCASGNRSLAAADCLVQRGIHAYSVAGGTAAWQRSGRPVVTGRPASAASNTRI